MSASHQGNIAAPFRCFLQLLFCICVAISSAWGSPSISECFLHPGRAAQCVTDAFPGFEHCVFLPTDTAPASPTSLSINASCLNVSNQNSTLERDATCSRGAWKYFAACLLAVTSNDSVVPNSTSSGCRPFANEDDCWANVALSAGCAGSLSGICAIGFGYPRANCAALAPSVASAAMCPIANGLLLCDDCTAGMSLTDQVAVAAARTGLQLANIHNEMMVFSNVSAYASSNVSMLLSDLNTFVKANEITVFLCGNDLRHFSSIVDFMAASYSGSSSKFFVTYLRLPLTRSTTSFPGVLFLSGRLDLLTYVAGYTLSRASQSGVILFSSHFPASTFERQFFIGFAAGAQDAVDNVTVVWGTSLPESLAARAVLSVDGISSGSVPQLVYPFLSQEVLAVGIFGDYLQDPATFNNQNTTQSQRLLFSVIGNLNAAVVAQFQAAALGNFVPGLWSGDASATTIESCVFSCHHLTPTVISSMRRSFSLIHRLGTVSGIDYSTGEQAIANSPIQFASPANVTGPKVANIFTQGPPTVVAIDSERIVLLSLDEPSISSRVVLLSMAVGHLQPTYLAAASSTTSPSRRVGYAVATDAESGVVFVSMGYSSETTSVLHGDVWSLTVGRFFQMSTAWVNASIAGSGGEHDPAPRFGHAMVHYDGVLYLFGGATALTAPADIIMHRFNTSASSWMAGGVAAPGSASGRVHHGMVLYEYPAATTWGTTVCRTWIFVAGGRIGADATLVDNLLVYCPSHNVWHEVTLGTSGLIGPKATFCMNILPPKFGSALVILGGSGNETSNVAIHVANGGQGTADMHLLPFNPAPKATSCAAVANSAMKLKADWALVVIYRAKTDLQGQPSNATSLAYYWPAPLSCPGNGASINAFSRLICIPCEENSYSDPTASHCVPCGQGDEHVHPRCAPTANIILIAFTTTLGGLFLIVVIPLAVRGVRSFRNLRRMEQSERVGAELCASVSALKFEGLSVLVSLKHPTRLQRAFLTIVSILVTYLQFMPMWVLAGDRVIPDRRKPSDAYGSRSSPEPRDEDDALPHRMPRVGSSSTVHGKYVPRQEHKHLEHPSDDDEESDRGSVSGTDSNDLPPMSALPLEMRLKRFQHKLLEAWVVVLHINFDSELSACWTVNVPSASKKGKISQKPDLERLTAFASGVTEHVDNFGGLIETQVNHRMIISFNGWRCVRDPELAAVRCAVSICSMVDAFKANAPSQIGSNLAHQPPDGSGLWGSGGGVHCGIASGFAHVGVVGRRYGQFAAILGPHMQDAAAYCNVAEVYNHRVVLPYLKVKTCIGGKIALRVIGEMTSGGSSSTSSRSEGNSIPEATISPRAQSVSSGPQERHFLCRVVGRRRSVGALQLQSLEAFNTLMEYIFQGAKAAAETLLSREGGSGSPTVHASKFGGDRQLLPEDRVEVEAAIVFGGVPRLDPVMRHAPSAAVPSANL